MNNIAEQVIQILKTLDPHQRVHHAQKMPAEQVAAIKNAANEKGISLELEMITRLIATFVNPYVFGIDLLCDEILNKSFTSNEAFAECRHNKIANQYIFELEKLKLLMRFEKRIPRSVKEHFALIDVKKARKIIEAELRAEEDKESL